MMNGNDLLAQLGDRLKGIRGKLVPNVMMEDVTWFRTGGPAQVMFQPADEEDLACFLKAVPQEFNILTIGVGSNLLIRDGGLPGFVVRLSARGFGGVEQISDTRLRVGTAARDKSVAGEALKASLSGFHFYHGIPGGIGGALRMNAGANGFETCQRVVEVRALDRSGNVHTLTNEDMGYAYRHSSASLDLIFVSAVMEGEKGDPIEIRAAMDEVQTHRETVQPIREKTGGSTFKNPPGMSAWKVIDGAGCRGLMIGAAQMSPMHCNFMINTGGASSADLEELGETVRARVLEHSGIRLEWEIKRLGEFKAGRVVQPFLGQML